jgi:Rrf2 family protein
MWYGFAPGGFTPRFLKAFPMLKISKLSDYGLLAAVYLSRKNGEVVAAREIADFYHLPLPVVSKVLKALHDGALIESHRGVGGGYSFTGDAEKITHGRLLAVLEGPWDLIDCETIDHVGQAVCAIRACCPSRSFMGGINKAIKHAFDQVTLGDLARGTPPSIAFAMPDADSSIQGLQS